MGGGGGGCSLHGLVNVMYRGSLDTTISQYIILDKFLFSKMFFFKNGKNIFHLEALIFCFS